MTNSMSEKVNLKRARIVELKHRLDGWETVALRYELGGSWELAGDIKRWTDDELHVTFMAFRVLAEFPVTLADLLPDGCEAFRFKRKYGVELTATKGTGTEADIWVIGGMQGHWRDLNTLSADLGVHLDTVVPLVLRVHPQYVEERR